MQNPLYTFLKKSSQNTHAPAVQKYSQTYQQEFFLVTIPVQSEPQFSFRSQAYTLVEHHLSIYEKLHKSPIHLTLEAKTESGEKMTAHFHYDYHKNCWKEDGEQRFDFKELFVRPPLLEKELAITLSDERNQSLKEFKTEYVDALLVQYAHQILQEQLRTINEKEQEIKARRDECDRALFGSEIVAQTGSHDFESINASLNELIALLSSIEELCISPKQLAMFKHAHHFYESAQKLMQYAQSSLMTIIEDEKVSTFEKKPAETQVAPSKPQAQKKKKAKSQKATQRKPVSTPLLSPWDHSKDEALHSALNSLKESCPDTPEKVLSFERTFLSMESFWSQLIADQEFGLGEDLIVRYPQQSSTWFQGFTQLRNSWENVKKGFFIKLFESPDQKLPSEHFFKHFGQEIYESRIDLFAAVMRSKDPEKLKWLFVHKIMSYGEVICFGDQRAHPVSHEIFYQYFLNNRDEYWPLLKLSIRADQKESLLFCEAQSVPLFLEIYRQANDYEPFFILFIDLMMSQSFREHVTTRLKYLIKHSDLNNSIKEELKDLQSGLSSVCQMKSYPQMPGSREFAQRMRGQILFSRRQDEIENSSHQNLSSRETDQRAEKSLVILDLLVSSLDSQSLKVKKNQVVVQQPALTDSAQKFLTSSEVKVVFKGLFEKISHFIESENCVISDILSTLGSENGMDLRITDTSFAETLKTFPTFFKNIDSLAHKIFLRYPGSHLDLITKGVANLKDASLLVCAGLVNYVCSVDNFESFDAAIPRFVQSLQAIYDLDLSPAVCQEINKKFLEAYTLMLTPFGELSSSPKFSGLNDALQATFNRESLLEVMENYELRDQARSSMRLS